MWLPLAEYSMKHKVSISTLRRKIKADDIQYRLDDGKYFIMDSVEEHRPSPNSEHYSTENINSLSGIPKADYLDQPFDRVQKQATAPAQNQVSRQNSIPTYTPHHLQAERPTVQAAEGESVITAANRLLSDLKKAYTQVLHEKEEQILSLKEENSDLKTLIKVLESENDRLRE